MNKKLLIALILIITIILTACGGDEPAEGETSSQEDTSSSVADATSEESSSSEDSDTNDEENSSEGDEGDEGDSTDITTEGETEELPPTPTFESVFWEQELIGEMRSYLGEEHPFIGQRNNQDMFIADDKLIYDHEYMVLVSFPSPEESKAVGITYFNTNDGTSVDKDSYIAHLKQIYDLILTVGTATINPPPEPDDETPMYDISMLFDATHTPDSGYYISDFVIGDLEVKLDVVYITQEDGTFTPITIISCFSQTLMEELEVADE